MAVGKDNAKFVGIGCVNIVVAVNADGAFRPFGDITTLMVWQKGLVEFQTFFALFIPSVVNYLVPAAVMSVAIPVDSPAIDGDTVAMKRGAKRITLLFFFGVIMCVGGLGFIDYLSELSLYAYVELRPTLLTF